MLKMTSTYTALLLFGLLICCTISPVNAQQQAILLPIISDIDAASQKELEEVLRYELKTMTALMPQDETLAHLKGLEQITTCSFKQSACPDCSEQDKECSRQLASVAEINQLFILKAERLHNNILLSLIQIDAKTGDAKAAAKEMFRGNRGQDLDSLRSEQRRSMRSLVVQIYSPDYWKNTHLLTGPEGYSLELDGKKLGTLPLENNNIDLSPGKHTLSFISPEGKRDDRQINSVYGEDLNLSFDSDDGIENGVNVPAWTMIALGSTVLITGIAAAAIGGYGLILGQEKFSAKREGKSLDQQRDQGELYLLTSYVLISSGALATLLGGGLAAYGFTELSSGEE